MQWREVSVPLDTDERMQALGSRRKRAICGDGGPTGRLGGLREKVNNGTILQQCRLRDLKTDGVEY